MLAILPVLDRVSRHEGDGAGGHWRPGSIPRSTVAFRIGAFKLMGGGAALGLLRSQGPATWLTRPF